MLTFAQPRSNDVAIFGWNVEITGWLRSAKVEQGSGVRKEVDTETGTDKRASKQIGRSSFGQKVQEELQSTALTCT